MTSFEEPRASTGKDFQGNGYQAIVYKDTLGPYNNHQLQNNEGQNPVEYTMCETGLGAELGFRSFYTNTDKAFGKGLAASIFGVVDSFTDVGRYSMQLKEAPHGSQYFVMEGTAGGGDFGFAYTELDPVDISVFNNVSVTAWVHIAGDMGQDSFVRVWATERQQGLFDRLAPDPGVVGREVSVQDWTSSRWKLPSRGKGNHLDSDDYNKWIEHTVPLPGFRETVVMSFGTQSSHERWSEGLEVWFDYVSSFASALATCLS